MKIFLKIGISLLCLCMSFVACSKEPSKGKAVAISAKAEVVAQFDGVLWGFDFLNEFEIIVTLRNGELFHYNLKTKKKKSLTAPKVQSQGQGGLLDVLIVNEKDKVYVYLTFSENYKDGITTSLARGEYVGGNIKTLKTIFRSKVTGGSAKHFGSRLLLKDNNLFMTIGDRGKRDFAQDLSQHNGSILKLTLEGKPALDNPYLKVKSALPEIWSYGHRNPQGIDLDPVTNKIYSIEFGPRGGDELNLISKKTNYGWPIITYGKEYWGPTIGPTHKKGMEQPVKEWTPSISPSGLAFYTGDKIKKWKNNLFIACLGGRHLRRVVLKEGRITKEEKLFEGLQERVRQIKNGKDGALYFSTDGGKIYKVVLSSI